MEIVWFRYYAHKPRIEVDFTMNLHTVPVIGDIIHVRGKGVVQYSPSLPDKDVVRVHGMAFVVVRREKVITTKCGEDWRIELGPLPSVTE